MEKLTRAQNLALKGAEQYTPINSIEQTNPVNDIKDPIIKANGRIRTDNPWFTKPELYR